MFKLYLDKDVTTIKYDEFLREKNTEQQKKETEYDPKWIFLVPYTDRIKIKINENYTLKKKINE